MDTWPKPLNSIKRIKILHIALLAVLVVFGLRLFTIQILQGGHYSKLALSDQQKQYQIPAERGTVSARDGSKVVPLVLNEKRYRLVADPSIIRDSDKVAADLKEFTETPLEDLKKQLTKQDSRYQIIGKNLTREQADKVKSLEHPGVLLEDTPRRTYPYGALAAQILGFVDDEGGGQYGIEQFLNDELAGRAGRVKAITDQRGVPLLATGDNVETPALDGKDIVLTIDVNIQRQLEDILKTGLERAISESGGGLILNANNGEIVAMANYPSYNPAEFSKVEDASLFTNAIVSSPLEPGSIMKTLTMAAAVDSGVVSPGDSFHDPGKWVIGDATVRNVEESGGSGTRALSDILKFSLNTGAVYLLRQMGGGEINEQGRTRWHDYMVDQFQLGKNTGIEQGYEAPGVIPDPSNGDGLDIQYANTSFGQGMTATPLQMAAALAAVVNGGTYYKPHLVAEKTDTNGTTEQTERQVVKNNVVKPEVGRTLVDFMQTVVSYNNRNAQRAGYIVGGKTGTAEIAAPEGGYYTDRYNGTYMGFVGGDKPEYIIIVRVNAPKIPGYAGTKAAAPIFADLSNMLINNFNVPSKKQ